MSLSYSTLFIVTKNILLLLFDFYGPSLPRFFLLSLSFLYVYYHCGKALYDFTRSYVLLYFRCQIFHLFVLFRSCRPGLLCLSPPLSVSVLRYLVTNRPHWHPHPLLRCTHGALFFMSPLYASPAFELGDHDAILIAQFTFTYSSFPYIM